MDQNRDTFYSHLQSSNTFTPKVLESVLVQAELDIHMVEPMEACSLYFTFNIYKLALTCIQRVISCRIFMCFGMY